LSFVGFASFVIKVQSGRDRIGANPKKAQTAQNNLHQARFDEGMFLHDFFINVYISIPSQLATLCMLHQTSLTAQNEELEREKDELKNELKLAEQQLMYLTGVHGNCHLTKQALEDEVELLTSRLEEATLQTNTTDSMQIVNEQELPVTPVVTPANNFVDSMTCFNQPLLCCPMSNDSLLQKIESLEATVDKYEKKIHPTPLYNPGRIGYHPDGSEDPEARAFMKNALELAETLSADDFESSCMHFNDLNLKHRVGIETAVSVIAEKIDGLIPFSSKDDKEIIVRAIITCAARVLVWKPEATEECQNKECKYFCMRCNCLLHNIIL
jgi:hypothetical protein